MSKVDLGARALAALAMLSAASTLAALAVFRRFSDRAAISHAANRVMAHLMELGLFFDEPMLVLRAQRDLVRENLRLLRGIALPCALLAVPFGFFFAELDLLFSRAPLVVGAPAIVTVNADDPAPNLEVPAGIEIETPPVRVAFSHQASWRVRPVENVSGPIKIALAGRTLAVPLYAGKGLVYGVPFTGACVEIGYPRATILHLNWAVWYVFTSMVTALAWNASHL